MDAAAYISSGMLEAYVLGDLTAIDREDVEEKLRTYPELKEALTLIEDTHEKILTLNAVTPPAPLKRTILDALDKRAGQTTTPQVWLLRSMPISRLAVAASLAAMMLVVGTAGYYYSQWARTSQALLTLTQSHLHLAEDFTQTHQLLQQREHDLGILENTAFTRVAMEGTSHAPAFAASVYWNVHTRDVYLQPGEVPPLPAGKQYQLWAIVDGHPVDAGVFDATDQLIKMKSVSGSVATFAVTIEPTGGRPIPTLETMQCAGNV